MDFLALYLTAVIRKNEKKALRMCAAAAEGAFYSALSLYLRGYAVFNFVILLLVGALMCFTAFAGTSPAGSACDFLTFCAISFSMGGFITALYGFLNKYTGRIQYNGNMYNIKSEISVKWLCILAAAGALITLAGERISCAKNNAGTGCIEFACEKGKSECKEKAEDIYIKNKNAKKTENVYVKTDYISDSGNYLCDPLSGLPVIVITPELARRIYPKPAADFLSGTLYETDKNMMEENFDFTDRSESLYGSYASRIRMIPASTVAGKGVMPGIRTGNIRINGTLKEAVVCASGSLDLRDGCEALIPDSLAV